MPAVLCLGKWQALLFLYGHLLSQRGLHSMGKERGMRPRVFIVSNLHRQTQGLVAMHKSRYEDPAATQIKIILNWICINKKKPR